MITTTPFEGYSPKFEVVSAFLDCQNETLLLHRAAQKPQGKLWAMIAGKVQKGERVNDALVREIEEEIGAAFPSTIPTFFRTYFIRYPDYDYTYHVYHIPLNRKLDLRLNSTEHDEYCWISPSEALRLSLIQYEDVVLKDFYKL